jgi:hypothetical protein
VLLAVFFDFSVTNLRRYVDDTVTFTVPKQIKAEQSILCRLA